MLDRQADRIDENIRPRANSSSCRARIDTLVSDLRHTWDRRAPRHPYAEMACQVDLLVANQPHYLVSPRGRSASEDMMFQPKRMKTAVLAFSMLTTVVPDFDQIRMLLLRIVRPKHAYLISVDAGGEEMGCSRGASISSLRGLLLNVINTHGLSPAPWHDVISDVRSVWFKPSRWIFQRLGHALHCHIMHASLTTSKFYVIAAYQRFRIV